MATVIRTPFGKIRGKIGDTVGRFRDGEYFVGNAPVTRGTTKNPNSLLVQSKFKRNVFLAKTIRTNEILNSIWKANITGKLNVNNYIAKRNAQSITSEGISQGYQLVPTTGGFLISLSGVMEDASGLEISFSPIGLAAAFDPAVETQLVPIIMDYMRGTEAEGYEQENAIITTGNPITPTNTDPLLFSLPVNPTLAFTLSKYDVKQRYCAVVSLDSEGKPVQYSITVYLS